MAATNSAAAALRRRIPAKAGYRAKSELARGPNGRVLCRECGVECKSSRQTFCSDACIHAWKLTTNRTYQAEHLFKRDRGICALCGMDCVAVRRNLDALASNGGHMTAEYQVTVQGLGLTPYYLCRRLWEMDHIVPVAEGGGGCGLENLRTLCWACHRKVTARQRLLRARRKLTRARV